MFFEFTHSCGRGRLSSLLASVLVLPFAAGNALAQDDAEEDEAAPVTVEVPDRREDQPSHAKAPRKNNSRVSRRLSVVTNGVETTPSLVSRELILRDSAGGLVLTVCGVM